MIPNEKVLCFPCHLVKYLDDIGQPTIYALDSVNDGILKTLLCPANLSYQDRASAEKDPSWKQVIPYVVIKDRDDIFRYQRTNKGGECRLHDKWSIGVGGHINPSDEKGCVEWTYQAAMQRELMEEVGLGGEHPVKVLGAIYDPTSALGRVHFGVVHLLDLRRPYQLSFHDEALLGGEFMPLAYLKNHADEFEDWSRLVLENLL